MQSMRDTHTFNQSDRFVQGWYWALPSRDLPRGQVKAVQLLGRELAVFRGIDGGVVAMDAYCPHMGAHLAEGKVEGNGLRCFFHNWKFAADGRCVDVPCLERAPQARVKTWPACEHYGLVWVWAGTGAPEQQPPYVPELQHTPWEAQVGGGFVKNCHPNVVLINAIDEHHFNSVHNLPVELHMQSAAVSRQVQTFSNTTSVSRRGLLTRFISRFYKGPLTYAMCYHFGSSGTVTLGPDFFHFHIMFALRLLQGGKTEGRTVLITKKRRGVRGWLVNRIALFLTRVVGAYFARGDTQVFQTMRFAFNTPTKADHAIIDFVQHIEQQPTNSWGTWEPVRSPGVSSVALRAVP